MAERNAFTVAQEQAGSIDQATYPRDYSEFPYDQITAEDIHFIMHDASQRMKEIAEKVLASETLTWDAIMAPIHNISDQESLFQCRIVFMGEVHPDQSVRDAVAVAKDEFERRTNAIWFNRNLYDKIKEYSKTEEAQELDFEEDQYLTISLHGMTQNGHEQDPATQKRLLEIEDRLNENTRKYESNIKNDKTVVLLSAKELQGLPERFIAELDRTDDGEYVVTSKAELVKSVDDNHHHIITMKYPHVDAIMMYADNRDVRQKVSQAFHSLGGQENRLLLEESLRLRREYAQLSGFASWAHYAMDPMMVEKPETVVNFYNELYDPLMRRAAPFITEMTDMLRADGHEGPLMVYDREYYIAKYQELVYGIDHKRIEEYLPLERCLKVICQIAEKLYGIKIKKVEDAQTWHEDVMTYRIEDKSGGLISTFHLDLFPREGKSTHPVTWPMQLGRYMPDGNYRPPETAVIANFNPPSDGKPSLLNYEQLLTLAHEMLGHLFHASLTQASYIELSGMQVQHDFVEVPSLLAENWMKEWTVLEDIAEHHETGEKLSIKELKNLIKAQQMYDVFELLRRMHLGDIDLKLHGPDPVADIAKVNLDSSARIALFLQEEGTLLPGKFVHIMNGYEAGYHAYPFSQAIADDIYYSKFKRHGITNRATGMRLYDTILSQGGVSIGEGMTFDMLGRKSNTKALLRRLGATAVN